MQSTVSSTRSKTTIASIILASFVNLMGVGIITPVLPALTARYTEPQDTVFVGSLLFTSYSLFQFIAVPTLGALSDRFGRRPVLLFCFVGSAFGYLISGVGGTLFMLFLGRIIDGVTGGNIAAIYAYAADITQPKERTRFFGLLGASAGLGFVFGPVLGGIVYTATGALEAPFIFSALVTLIAVIGIYFFVPESHPPERRDTSITLERLNPFVQLYNVFKIPALRLILVGIFMWMVPFALLQANLGFLMQDRFGWTPDQTSVLFVMIGLVQVIVQGGLIRVLLNRFTEGSVAVAGLIMMVIGFVLVAVSITFNIEGLAYFNAILLPFGNALVIPTTTGLLSRLVSGAEQGRVQGGNQSVQALARVMGPLVGGWTYTLGAAITYVSGAGLLVISALAIGASVLQVRRAAAKAQVSPSSEVP